MRNNRIFKSPINSSHKWGSILLVVMLITSGLFIFMPSNLKLSSAEDCPSSTERADNDFNNGTLDNVTIINNGTATELRLKGVNSNNWTKLDLIKYPLYRQKHSIASIYDTNKVLLFGGIWGGSIYLNDTWVFDFTNNTWTQKKPLIFPDGRYAHAMAPVWGTDKIVLFGGYANRGFPNYHLDETWVYDLSENNWTQKTPTINPSARYCHAMASIYGEDKVVIFGGDIWYQDYVNDTWVYDLSNNTWTQKFHTTKPSIRSYHAMASIYSEDKVILFGGENESIINDTWVYDLSDNNWIEKKPKSMPNGRMRHSLASIHKDDKVLLFGGAFLIGMNYDYYNDTWIYDLSENIWWDMTPKNHPSVRACHAMASIDGTKSVLLFGGSNDSILHLNDTWTYYLHYYVNGTYVSSPNKIGKDTTLTNLSWNANISINTNVEFQLRTADNKLNLALKNFVGPDGNTTTYYTSSSSNIWLGHNRDRWIQYKAYLSTNNYEETPRLKNVSITYNNWPNTTLISPINRSIININKPTFVWNFTDQDSTDQIAFQVLIDDNFDFKTIDYDSGEQNRTNQSWYFPEWTIYTGITNGVWHWKVRTKDNDGDWGHFSQPWKIIIDNNGPHSIITKPQNNRFYNNLVIISGKAFESIDGTDLNRIGITIKRLDDNSYWTGSNWASLETWLLTSGTKKWSYNSNSVIWHSGFKYNIRSRAIDNATNIEIPKAGKIITMDFDNVTFSNAFPLSTEVSTTEDVEVGITISDQISGVNASTIEYKISKDRGKTWTLWEPVTGLESGKTINITLNLNFPNGTGNRIKWRASDIAGNGPTESKVYVVIVNTWLLEWSIPKVILLSPPNGSVIASTALELSWRLVNKDLLNVIYDVYLDTAYPPVKINHSGIINTTVIIENLSNGVTYYWTVIPKTAKINGSCESGVWSFTIIIPIPKVNLISPENNSIINDFQPGLSWSVEYDGNEILSYNVHFGTSIDPKLEFKDHPSTNCFIKERLIDGETYYWKVVPWAGDYLGLVSETWSFTVNQGHLPHFELELFILPPVVELPPGNIKQVKAIVSNLGELEDSILLRIEVPPDSGVGAIVDEPSIISVIPHAIAEFNIMVTTSMDAPNQEVILTVIASSRRAPEFGLIVEEEAELTVKILNKEKKDEDKPWLSFSEFWIIFLIIIIILIVLFIVWMVLKQKKISQETKEESTPEDSVTVKPESVPEAIISDGQTPGTTTSPQLPETTENVESQQQTQTIAKVPTLASSTTPGQVPTIQQIPEVTPQPKLPPTQNRETKAPDDKSMPTPTLATAEPPHEEVPKP